MPGRTDGMAAAVEQAMADQPAAPIARVEQLPLLPANDLDDLPEGRAARQAAMRAPRKAGRPAGAVNRSTKEWREFLLQRYPSPLQVLCETYNRAVSDIAAELGCTRLEAFRIQIQAAAEAAPYLHGKMPVEVHVQGQLPVINLVDPRDWARGQGASEVEIEILMDQGLSIEHEAAVGQSELDSTGNAQADQRLEASDPLIEHQSAGADQGEDQVP